LRAPRWAHLGLVLAAFFFGSTFVVVKDAVHDVGPVPFLAVRFLVAAALTWPLAARRPTTEGWARAGFWCGLSLLAGYLLQTIGLQYTSSSVSAFITYLLVVIVPVLSAVTFRRAPSPSTMGGVALAVVGLFLLNGATLSLGKGQLLTLGCAFAFAVHIVLLAHVAPRHDVLRLNAVQLVVVGGGCLLPGFVTGGYDFTARALWAAVYTGVFVSAVAFGLMVWAQQTVGPSRTALILMLEPVFAGVVGYAVGDRLGATGVLGAVLILGGIGIAELDTVLRARVRAVDRAGDHRAM
jgi:drug/metabolite transporter (DMT)-like permease